MPEKHRVRPGDSLLELAYDGGFETWKKVWDHEANAELRELRKDPQVLLPGDTVVIPDRDSTPTAPCPVDKVHRFRLTRPRAWVNLRMVDDQGQPLPGARYRFVVEGHGHEGTTDEDGMVSVEIRPDAHDGRLTVWFDDSEPPLDLPVKIGHLDPVSAWSGARARLMNLGTELTAHDDREPDTTLLSHPMGVLARVATQSSSATDATTLLEQEHDPCPNQE